MRLVMRMNILPIIGLVLLCTLGCGRSRTVDTQGVAHRTGERESGLESLVLEGHELHASLRTREPDHRNRHLPPGVLPPGNPHLSADAAFVEIIARGASQSRLGREGIRSVLYALYVGERELGFYGLEAESVADANQRKDALREVWAHNARMGIARVHRAGLVLLVVWHDGVSPECWSSVNARVLERLNASGSRSVD